MSVLVRFETTTGHRKARLYERASKRGECQCCGKKDWGILIRHLSPEKKDTHICNICIVKLSLKQIVRTTDPNKIVSVHEVIKSTSGKKRGPKAKPGPKKKRVYKTITDKPVTPKTEVINDEPSSSEKTQD